MPFCAKENRETVAVPVPKEGPSKEHIRLIQTTDPVSGGLCADTPKRKPSKSVLLTGLAEDLTSIITNMPPETEFGDRLTKRCLNALDINVNDSLSPDFVVLDGQQTYPKNDEPRLHDIARQRRRDIQRKIKEALECVTGEILPNDLESQDKPAKTKIAPGQGDVEENSAMPQKVCALSEERSSAFDDLADTLLDYAPR